MTRKEAIAWIDRAWKQWDERDGIGQGEWGGKPGQSAEEWAEGKSDAEIMKEAREIGITAIQEIAAACGTEMSREDAEREWNATQHRREIEP